MAFEIACEPCPPHDDLFVLSLHGALDIDCTPLLQAEGARLAEGACRHLLLVLDDLVHIDSKGLGTFLEMRQRLRGKGGTVSMVCTQPNLRRLFRITNLERLFAFHDSVEAFLRLHGGQPERVSAP